MSSAVVAEHRFHGKTRAFEAARHLRDRQRPERELEAIGRNPAAPPLEVALLESGQRMPSILMDRLDERQVRSSRRSPPQLDLIPVFTPIRNVSSNRCRASFRPRRSMYSC